MQKQVTFLLRLDTEDNLWKNLNKKVRNQIRKAQEYHLEIKERGTLLDFYSLYQKVMKKRGSPPYGYKFFEDIIEEFGDKARVFIAKYNDISVAGMVALQFGDRIASMWAASDYDFSHLNPNNFLYWEVIKWAANHNFKYFDFGRSPKSSGTYFFKRQWGGKEKPFSHSYYLSPSGKRLVPIRTQSKWLQKLWRLVPGSAANLLGPIIRKYIK